MPSTTGRVRSSLLAVLAVTTVGASLATVGPRLFGVTSLHAGAATLVAAGNLQRPSWFHLRVLSGAPRFTDIPPVSAPPAITASAGILVDADTGAVLWEHDDHRRMAPASTTKIVSALVALENLDPATSVTVSADALHLAADETRMGLGAGEAVTVRDLLTGMLLVSGNDAATALAVDTVGMERFVAAMNAQMAALGLHDSHFVTPVGLDEPGQYSSAYDLAVVSAVAMSFPLFAQLVGSQHVMLPAAAGHPAFDLSNINMLLSMYPAAVGIKPGYTGNAGYCEVGMAVRGGHRLISVLLDGDFIMTQSRRLLDWGFQQEGLPSTLPAPSPSAAAHG